MNIITILGINYKENQLQFVSVLPSNDGYLTIYVPRETKLSATQRWVNKSIKIGIANQVINLSIHDILQEEKINEPKSQDYTKAAKELNDVCELLNNILILNR